MTWRWLLILTVFLLANSADASPKKPNILFLLTDDQRFDALGCAGHPILKTPTIDGLAAQGVRFKNAFVTTPICAASRATLLTGLYERSHKYTFGTPPISAQQCERSYPALLKRAGYRTGFTGKFGVQVAADMIPKMFDWHQPIGWPFVRKKGTDEARHIDQIAADCAIDFLGKVDREQPFCLSVSFNGPHADDGKIDDLYPWPKTVDGFYADAEIKKPPHAEPKYFDALPEFLRKSMGRTRWGWQFDSEEKYQKNVRGYFRMISGIDREIARILAELRRLGLADDTIVVFMSDNGYFLGEYGLSGKWVHFEDSLRVPLIVMDPRLPAERRGKTIDAIALNVDIAPTFIDWAGLPVEPSYQGKSLAPLVRGDPAPGWRTDFFCEHLMVSPTIPMWEGVRGSQYVYARYFGQKPAYEFLHDLKSDPKEIENLATAATSKEALDLMRRRCDELREAVGGEYSPERFPTLPKKK